MADPGFPRRRRQPPGGAPAYYLAKLSRKLHENERNLTRGACLTSDDICIGFQSQIDRSLACMPSRLCAMGFLRFTSGATSTDLLAPYKYVYVFRVEGSSKATGRPHTPIEQLKKSSTHSKHKKKKKHDAPEKESAPKKEPGIRHTILLKVRKSMETAIKPKENQYKWFRHGMSQVSATYILCEIPPWFSNPQNFVIFADRASPVGLMDDSSSSSDSDMNISPPPVRATHFSLSTYYKSCTPNPSPVIRVLCQEPVLKEYLNPSPVASAQSCTNSLSHISNLSPTSIRSVLHQ